MIVGDYIIFALATLMYAEDKENGLQIPTACGLVIRNRAIAGWDGGDWITLIRKNDSYSAWPERKRAIEWGDPLRDDKFRRCLGIANNIYDGREKDITYGALRYAKLNDVSEDFCNKIVRPTTAGPGGSTELVHKRVASIGQYQFFR